MDELKKLQPEINRVLEKYSNSQDTFRSIGYLILDISLVAASTTVMYYLQPYLYFQVWWFLHAIITGTIAVGIWVLSHEMGHGAFFRSQLLCDILGLFTHSALLTSFYTWQYSHKKHHKYTNHLIMGESHVPGLKTPYAKFKAIVGDDAFTVFVIFGTLLFGWFAYLFYNITGGRTDYKGDRKNSKLSVSHFHPDSQIFPPSMRWKIIVSNIFLCLALTAILSLDYFYGLGTSLKWYWGPYLVVNSWLVGYTYLQHTHPNIPHYGNDDFTFLKGALSTVDRNYPKIIDILHHHIGTTHVLHHINYKIPHYHAQAATKEIREVLGDKYNIDSRNILVSLWEAFSQCHYVSGLEGTQYFKK